MTEMKQEAPREFFGDPGAPVWELGGYEKHGEPRDGDELYNQYQALYEWKAGRWR